MAKKKKAASSSPFANGDASPPKKKRASRARKAAVPEVDADGNVAIPVEARPVDDPGDDVQRRFRYQHAYGVILLLRSILEPDSYKCIWCEFHDDYLAQSNGHFDCYQIKTGTPEHGPWDLGRPEMIGSLKKFSAFATRFPGRHRHFYFVSNVKQLDTQYKPKIHKSPLQFVAAIAKAKDQDALAEPFKSRLAPLAEKCETDTGCLFTVLKNLKFIDGPSLNDFEVVVASTHVAKLPACQHLSQVELSNLRDELIQKVYEASSRVVDGPDKHWYCVNGKPAEDPWLKAKQLPPSIVEVVISQKRTIPFRYAPVQTTIDQQNAQGELSKFQKKLKRAGLDEQLETMKRRTISAERHLFELAASKPERIAEIKNQIECFVQGACDDAKLARGETPPPYGPSMLRDLQEKLQKTVDESPDMVCNQPFEFLVGVAGLLTEGCKVWWGPKFPLEEAQ